MWLRLRILPTKLLQGNIGVTFSIQNVLLIGDVYLLALAASSFDRPIRLSSNRVAVTRGSPHASPSFESCRELIAVVETVVVVRCPDQL